MRLLSIIIFSVITIAVSAQQQFTPLSQYMLNRAYLNPAYTGEGELYNLTALYRTQWSGYRDYLNKAIAPELQLFTGTLNIDNTEHSLGVMLNRDKIGYITNLQAQISYAHNIRLSQTSALSLGIRTGINSRTIDFSRHIVKEHDDPLIPQEKQTESSPDLSLGLWYDHQQYYFGLSAKGLIKGGSSLSAFRNKSTYVATAGYKADINPHLNLLPSVQVIADEENVSFDAGALVNFNEALHAGLTYRHQQAVAAIVGAGFLQSTFKVSYAFDYVTNNKEVTANTSHEIMLSYRAGTWKRKTNYKLKKSKVKPGKPIMIVRDKDNDGVPDDKDECIDIVGERKFNGCPDKDSDNVPDKDDHCPDTYGLKDFAGCPDTDKDEIPDHEDNCPEEAGPVTLKGCPDRDKDGTADKEDECPDVPGLPEHQGCPLSLTQEKLEHITFTTGQATLEKSSYSYLDEVVTILKKYSNTQVIIEGHTDSEGDDNFNLHLSARRAEMILDYFIEKGIDPERLSTEGYGESRPVDTNDTPEGRRKNRRVEIHFVKEVPR